MDANLMLAMIGASSPSIQIFGNRYILDRNAVRGSTQHAVLVDVSRRRSFREDLLEEYVDKKAISYEQLVDDAERYLKQKTWYQLVTRCYEQTNDSAIEKVITVAVGGGRNGGQACVFGKVCREFKKNIHSFKHSCWL